jgi:hypothetical protein
MPELNAVLTAAYVPLVFATMPLEHAIFYVMREVAAVPAEKT